MVDVVDVDVCVVWWCDGGCCGNGCGWFEYGGVYYLMVFFCYVSIWLCSVNSSVISLENSSVIMISVVYMFMYDV